MRCFAGERYYAVLTAREVLVYTAAKSHCIWNHALRFGTARLLSTPGNHRLQWSPDGTQLRVSLSRLRTEFLMWTDSRGTVDRWHSAVAAGDLCWWGRWLVDMLGPL